MEIKIDLGEGQKVILSNEEIDNDNFVELCIENATNDDVIIPIDEFLAAVTAFKNQQMLRLEKESLMD